MPEFMPADWPDDRQFLAAVKAEVAQQQVPFVKRDPVLERLRNFPAIDHHLKVGKGGNKIAWDRVARQVWDWSEGKRRDEKSSYLLGGRKFGHEGYIYWSLELLDNYIAKSGKLELPPPESRVVKKHWELDYKQLPSPANVVAATAETMLESDLPLAKWEEVLERLKAWEGVRYRLLRYGEAAIFVGVWEAIGLEALTWAPQSDRACPEDAILGEWDFGHRAYYLWPLELVRAYTKDENRPKR